MAKKVSSEPNNKIAIICTRYDNQNNTYTITPLEIALGKIDENGYFNSENGEYHVPSIENFDCLTDPNVEKFYAFMDSYEQLAMQYQMDEVESLMAKYYIDIASQLLIALVDNGLVRVYTTDYANISNEIQGSISKRFEEAEDDLGLGDEVVAIPADAPKSHLSLTPELIDNEDLERYLKERIIENDEIIEDIVTTIAMNYSATNYRDVKAILSIGPTGSGKTETFRLIAEYLGVVLTMFDCTQLTASGYVGKDIDDICRKIYYNSHKDRTVAERSILVLDEIDKLAGRGNDVTDVNVQYELLKFIEGAEYNFELEKRGSSLSGATIDTSFMTIAGLGAFSDIHEAKKKKQSLGFNTSETVESVSKITTSDLMKYGLIDQLLGRFSLVCQYRDLDKDALAKILLTSKNSPLLRKVERYHEQFLTDLSWDPSFIEALVEYAIIQKNGARGLNKAIDHTFTKLDRAMYTDLRHSGAKEKKLILTSDIVSNPSKFSL